MTATTVKATPPTMLRQDYVNCVLTNRYKGKKKIVPELESLRASKYIEHVETINSMYITPNSQRCRLQWDSADKSEGLSHRR